MYYVNMAQVTVSIKNFYGIRERCAIEGEVIESKAVIKKAKPVNMREFETKKDAQDFLEKNGSATLKTGTTLAELLCRPELNYEMLKELDVGRAALPKDVIEHVEIEIKYEGYIDRQLRQVEQFKKMEKKLIPDSLDYDDVLSLRLEARQKLKSFRPVSVGQASRISGVSPADISVLLVYLEQLKRKNYTNGD